MDLRQRWWFESVDAEDAIAKSRLLFAHSIGRARARAAATLGAQKIVGEAENSRKPGLKIFRLPWWKVKACNTTSIGFFTFSSHLRLPNGRSRCTPHLICAIDSLEE